MSNTSDEREGPPASQGDVIRVLGSQLAKCKTQVEQLTQELERETTRAREAEQELTRRGRRERAEVGKLREAQGGLSETVRVKMLETPCTDERDTFHDGFHDALHWLLYGPLAALVEKEQTSE